MAGYKGQQGGRPKPTALRMLNGNAGRRHLNEDEPMPPPGDVTMPSWLKKHAAEAWDQEAPAAIEMGVLTIADVEAFALYCAALGEYHRLYALLLTRGSSYKAKTEHGYIMRPRPEVQQASDAWKRAKSMAIEFGLTASSRTRVKAAPRPKEKSALEKLRDRRPG